MDYLITGTTGLVGSHILFELLNEIISNNLISNLYLLVRPIEKKTPEQRIRDLLTSEYVPFYIQNKDLKTLLKHIQIIPHHLNCSNLSSALKDITYNDLTVIHCAASTNLMNGKNAKIEIFSTNNIGTKNLIECLESNRIHKFVYISTAFSCGIQSVQIPNNYLINENNSFRNPYEENKAIIEKFIATYCDEKNIKYQILRPAVVCGRLIEKPLYYTSKFDVFYGWAGFFYKIKETIQNSLLRIFINEEGTLNIVPVDYVAKIVSAALKADSIKELNIINPNPPFHKDYFSIILKTLGIKNYSFVSSVPRNLNKIEHLYYKTAGKAFAPYITTENQDFNSDLLLKEFNEIVCPNILDSFEHLIKFAIHENFGKNNYNKANARAELNLRCRNKNNHVL